MRWRMNQGQVLAPYHSNARALGALQGLFQSVESVLPAGAEGAHPQQARFGGVRVLVTFVFVVPAELFGTRVGKARIRTSQTGEVQLQAGIAQMLSLIAAPLDDSALERR